MRQVDVFSWLTTERQKIAARLQRLLESSPPRTNWRDAADHAHDCAYQAARLETIDNLLSQLQEH